MEGGEGERGESQGGLSLLSRLSPPELTKLGRAALEASQWQMDGLCSQFPYKCHLEEVASVGDCLEIFPQLYSRVDVKCSLVTVLETDCLGSFRRTPFVSRGRSRRRTEWTCPSV